MPNTYPPTPKTFKNRVRAFFGLTPSGQSPMLLKDDVDACAIAFTHVMGHWTYWDAATPPPPPKGRVPFEEAYFALALGLPVAAAYVGYTLNFLPVTNGALLSGILLAIPAIHLSRLTYGWLARQIELYSCHDLARDGGLYVTQVKLATRSGLPMSSFNRKAIYDLAVRYRNEYLPKLQQEYKDAVARKEREDERARQRRQAEAENRGRYYASAGAGSSGGHYYRDDDYYPQHNAWPAYNSNGMPMLGNSGIDAAGNTYGSDHGGGFGGFNN